MTRCHLDGRPDFMIHYLARYRTKHAGIHQVLRSEVENGVIAASLIDEFGDSFLTYCLTL